MRFEDYHPAINLLFFASVIAFSIIFRHPVFVALAFVCSYAYAIKKGRTGSLITGLILIPLAFLYGFWFAAYNHFGVTNLRTNFAGNQITLESLLYGIDKGFVIASVVLWACCVFAVFTSDKIVYLFGKVSPRLSLFLSILLRSVPRIIGMGRKINISQQGIGRGINQGNIFQRIRNFFRLLSILITWTMESLVTSSDSMKSRGYTLRGRTAFSIYRFDNRDRAFVICLTICMTFTAMGYMLDQMFILFKPRIIMNRITPLSFLFYAAYAVLCLMPMTLELIGEKRFEKLRSSV